MKEGKKALNCGLVGFFKSPADGLRNTNRWVSLVMGRIPVRLSLLEEPMVWMMFVSEQEAGEVRQRAISDLASTTFSLMERWMEVLGHPPRSC